MFEWDLLNIQYTHRKEFDYLSHDVSEHDGDIYLFKYLIKTFEKFIKFCI